MNKTEDTSPAHDDQDSDVLAPIREHEDEIEDLGEREDRIGAIARYFLALKNGEQPTDYDADLAGLPRIDDEGGEK